MNPARVKHPQELATYRWSSPGAYLGRNGAVAVDTALVLNQLGNSASQAYRAYRKFIDDAPFNFIGQAFVGAMHIGEFRIAAVLR